MGEPKSHLRKGKSKNGAKHSVGFFGNRLKPDWLDGLIGGIIQKIVNAQELKKIPRIERIAGVGPF